MSQAVHIDELEYRTDSCELFEQLRELPHAALLDSSYPYSSSGRYDILVADPQDDGLPTLPAKLNELTVGAYFTALGDFHRQRYADVRGVTQEMPFCGGLLGVLGYDEGNALQGVTAVQTLAKPQPPTPSTTLHAYDWCVLQDHLLRRAVLISLPWVSAAKRKDLIARLRPQSTLTEPQGEVSPFRLSEPWSSNLTREDYGHAFEKIAQYILAGDCYQVNLAQRFSAAYEGDPWVAYQTLRRVAAAPFSAYFEAAALFEADTPGKQSPAVLCLSPERFLSLHGQRVETAPIKGTRPRAEDFCEDLDAAIALRNSDKDRAENLMIVDLLRNDLGRSCVPGSIHVDRLFDVISLPTVHHLVSTISGDLRADRGAWELLRDSFPGGSITGAPKRRAMEIIHELEPDPRAMYCGSVVYVSADGRMDSNIAIRTLRCQDGQIDCWAGGGIVADSRCDSEYQETWDKVGKLLDALDAL